MAVSLYQATVPQLLQLLSAAIANLDQAEQWAKEQGRPEEEVLKTALASDMWPLAKQFQVIAGHSAGAIRGAITGTFGPDLSEPPMTFAGLRSLLESALADLKATDPAAVDGAEDNDVSLEVRGNVLMRFKGGDFLLSFAQPNFYFHVTTAYAILRHLGVPLGKRDFIGMPRVQQPA